MRQYLIACLLCGLAAPALSADTIGFWNTPQHGANSFNESPPDAAYFRAFRAYLEDVLAALDANGIHWAFYSFRESWDGMDYELGGRKIAVGLLEGAGSRAAVRASARA